MTDGLDHSADLTVASYWQATAAGVSATWSCSGLQDMAVIVTGAVAGAPIPFQPNPAWPVDGPGDRALCGVRDPPG